MGFRDDGETEAGCFMAFAGVLIAVLVLAFAAGFKARSSEDPYYKDLRCDDKKKRDRIEITASGFPRQCALVILDELRFENALTEVGVRVCLGRAGDCETHEGAPDELSRGVTIPPGGTGKLSFPPRDVWGFDLERKYPITVISDLGSAFPRSDMVIDRKVDQQ